MLSCHATETFWRKPSVYESSAEAARELVGRGRESYESDRMPRLAGEAVVGRIGDAAAKLRDQVGDELPGRGPLGRRRSQPVAAKATTAETPPATNAGVRVGSNGSGLEYSIPTGLVQSTVTPFPHPSSDQKSTSAGSPTEQSRRSRLGTPGTTRSRTRRSAVVNGKGSPQSMRWR